AVAAGREQDFLAVWRPGGVPAVVLTDLLEIAAVRVHDEDAAATPHGTAEGDLFAVGRPGGGATAVGALGQLFDVAAVGIHDIDVHGAVAIGSEGDFFAVRRPGGIRVFGAALRQIRGLAAFGIDQEDFRIAGPF